MAVGIANPEQTLLTEAAAQNGKIIIQQELIGNDGNLLAKTGRNLERILGVPLDRIGGGTSKEVFADEARSHVYSLIKEHEGPIWAQASEQVHFYQLYSQEEDFRRVVVPLERVIEDKDGNILGMEQEYYGIPLSVFLQRGGRISRNTINCFVEDYRQLIKRTGFAHGDFVIGSQEDNGQIWYSSDLENIRVGPNGELRFIDYHGRNGILAYKENHYPGIINGTPTDPDYLKTRDSDPERTRDALYRLFNYASVKTPLRAGIISPV